DQAPSTTSPTCPVVTCEPFTTEAITTEGPTVTPNLEWRTVGADRFVRFDQKITWNEARNVCRSHGLELYMPKDILNVSKYLDDTFSNGSGMWHWLGGRANGTHMVWLSGDVLTREDPWYSTGYSYVSTNYCLYFLTHSGWATKAQVLYSYLCDYDDKFYVVCG
ncbi:unnamed protein product, partial [Meganyctiphanes norvegica]